VKTTATAKVERYDGIHLRWRWKYGCKMLYATAKRLWKMPHLAYFAATNASWQLSLRI